MINFYENLNWDEYRIRYSYDFGRLNKKCFKQN